MNTLRTHFIALSSLLLIAFSPDFADEITVAINSGNPKNISKYFIENIDLKVIDKEGVYSKQQAEMILKDFFAKHIVKTYTVVHKSTPKNGSHYIIGTLVTSKGTFRVYCLNKTEGAKTVIQQFRIETENE
jgi:Domain of unknown function (DUF4783)